MTSAIYVTEAPNDDDLYHALSCVSPVRCPIPHGDVLFFGIGLNNKALKISVERKHIGDMASCILTGRYLFQAQRAHSDGLSDVLILIIEGELRANPDDDLIEIPMWVWNPATKHKVRVWEPVLPNISYNRWDQYLTELDYLAGVIVKRSSGVKETADIVKASWLNFQTPPLEHSSLKQIYEAPLREVVLMKPSLVRRVAVQLPGIGWERSVAVDKRFSTMLELANAGIKDWSSISGIGKKTAEKVVKAVRGEL